MTRQIGYRTRRRVLAGIAVTAAGGLAGCSGGPNKLAYSTDVNALSETESRVIVTGTYGREGGWLSGGKAAYAELEVRIEPTDAPEETDTVELFFDPPGTEGDFRSESVVDVPASQVRNGTVTVEVVKTESEVTFNDGAD